MNIKKANAGACAVGLRMKQFREEKDYTIQRMAVSAGIDPKHLKKIETGVSEPSVIILWKFMNCLDKDMTDLFDEEYDQLYLSCITEEDDDEN